ETNALYHFVLLMPAAAAMKSSGRPYWKRPVRSVPMGEAAPFQSLVPRLPKTSRTPVASLGHGNCTVNGSVGIAMPRIWFTGAMLITKRVSPDSNVERPEGSWSIQPVGLVIGALFSSRNWAYAPNVRRPVFDTLTKNLPSWNPM